MGNKWREYLKANIQNSFEESSATDDGIDWREIFHKKLETQLESIRHKATERGFEVNVHVPLGLLERKHQQRNFRFFFIYDMIIGFTR